MVKIMTNEEKMKQALMFAFSMRGRYIISQALWNAIKRMEEIPPPFREQSNINDMKYLLDTLFTIFKVTKDAEQNPAFIETFGLAFVCLNCNHAWKTKKQPNICPKCKSKRIRRVE
jgi:Zn finger protein HypA/HybF involved in hydrogenase expression